MKNVQEVKEIKSYYYFTNTNSDRLLIIRSSILHLLQSSSG